MMNATHSQSRLHASAEAPKTVVIVNGDTESIDTLEFLLDVGKFKTIHVLDPYCMDPYRQIKLIRPDAVILYIDFKDPETLQVLSMLKLDEDTKKIPVITCFLDPDESETDDATSSKPKPRTDDDLFLPIITKK